MRSSFSALAGIGLTVITCSAFLSVTCHAATVTPAPGASASPPRPQKQVLELGFNPNQVAEKLDGIVSRSHVCDYLTRRSSMGSHKVQHLLKVLNLEIQPKD
jgi:hypothetical protein